MKIINYLSSLALSIVVINPYSNPVNNMIPLGELSSGYAEPWKTYCDTPTSSRFLDSLGINFNRVKTSQVEAVSETCSLVGINRARIELGWGGFDYFNPGNPTASSDYIWRPILQSFKNNGIRPLILLNSNGVVPCPYTGLTLSVTAVAPAGANSITVSNISGIVPGKTGLNDGQRPGTMAYPLITSVDPSTGICTLSAPLMVSIPIGNLACATLLYHPFTGPFAKDGVTQNSWSQETLDGWIKYCLGCCAYVKSILGTDNFDLELWNELTFGSQILSESNYYAFSPNQDPSFRVYSNWGQTTKGSKAFFFQWLIAPAADAIKAAFPGVTICNGFTNTLPYATAASQWHTVGALSRHFYAADTINTYGWFYNIGHTNALGQNDGISNPPGQTRFVLPYSFFMPNSVVNCPEEHLMAIRDPWCIIRQQQATSVPSRAQLPPGALPWWDNNDWMRIAAGQPLQLFWRGMTNIWGDTGQLWETEFNFDISRRVASIASAAGLPVTDPSVKNLAQWLDAKSLLRSYVFHSHKHVQEIYMYSVNDGNDIGYSLFPQSYFSALSAAGDMFTNDVFFQTGKAILSLANLTWLFQEDSGSISQVHPLTMQSFTELDPVLEFSGDGLNDGRHPDHHLVDDLFVGPYQASDSEYLIPFYVVTLNAVHNYGITSNPLDPVNYILPDHAFTVAMSGFAKAPISAGVYDPILGTFRRIPFQYDGSTLSVTVQSSDYPRVLIVNM